jgi:hypothetical protein
MLEFMGFAFLVQLLLAVAVEAIKDIFSAHRRALARPLGLPTSIELLFKAAVAKVLHWWAIAHWEVARGGSRNRLVPFCADAPSAPTQLVIFVRGTFGSLGYDSRWTKLADSIRHVHPDAAFFRFNWAGRNGEAARRADGAVLAALAVDLAARYPGVALLAIGHSHGGSVIEHAVRSLDPDLILIPVVLGAPDLAYAAKDTDLPDARLTALLYSSVLIAPAFLIVVLSWVFAAFGMSSLMGWTAEWLLPLGLLLVVFAFLLRPLVWKARALLSEPLPLPSRRIARIWCAGDEIFDLFRRADAVRLALHSLRDAFGERLERLKIEPWLRLITFEVVAAYLCWSLIFFAVKELAVSDPAMLHPLVREPGPVRDMIIVGSALMLKLIAHWRPRLYRALASITSLVLFAMNVGLAHLCRVTLAGLAFTEGILVEVLFHEPIADGESMREVTSRTAPKWNMALHAATLADDGVLKELLDVMRERLPRQ